MDYPSPRVIWYVEVVSDKPAVKTPKIVARQVASVSTAHIQKADGVLLLHMHDGLPRTIARRYGGMGFAFWFQSFKAPSVTESPSCCDGIEVSFHLDLDEVDSVASSSRCGGLGISFHLNLDEAEFERQIEDLREVGISDAFVNVLRAVHAAGIDRVELSRDGGLIEGLPTFEW
jgi:hypothetical protein